MDAALPWPATTPPRLKLAGQFPLADRRFATTYLGAAHALHLHGYAGRMRLGGAEVEIQPGDLTLSPAGVASAYDLAAPGRHWCVHFHPAEETGPTVPLPLHLRLGSAATYAAERLSAVSRLHARAAVAGPADVLAQASAAVAFQELLLWCVARARHEDAPAGDALADRVAALVEARFAEPLTAERLAREVGRSQHYIAQVFRQRFGMTVPRYTLQRRMAHARYLLESTDLPVAGIAERVGVHDPHYFNKLVRRFLGGSPTAVRRRARDALNP
jgi:AraC-like DNA-binding protein